MSEQTLSNLTAWFPWICGGCAVATILMVILLAWIQHDNSFTSVSKDNIRPGDVLLYRAGTGEGRVVNTKYTENHLEIYGDSDWQDGWPETIVVFNTKTLTDEVYVRYRPVPAAEPST